MPHKYGRFSQRMARSRATNRMRRLFQAHLEADTRGVPVDEVLGELKEQAEIQRLYAQKAISRREFLRRMGMAGATVAAVAAGTKPAFTQGGGSDTRVVIIGAGVAGLRCAHWLAQHGVVADIYEADHRIGGRIATHETTPPPGSRSPHHKIQFALPTEHGGSFISTEHTAIRNLTNSLGLSLDVINGGGLLDGEELYLIDGEFYTEEEANADWQVTWQAFKDELQAAPWPQTFENHTQRGIELDNISTPQWFDPKSPYSNPILAEFGPDSRFAKLCYSDVVVEYGGDHDVQPALNLLYLLAWNPRNSLQPLPGTDEYYTISGGISQLVHRMVAQLPGEIHVDTALEAITGDFEGPYTCHFSKGPSVVADKLVFALPFRILRELDIDPRIWNGFRPEKQFAISQLPMGTNAKIHVELSHRTWGPGYEREINGQQRLLNGIAYSDVNDFQCVWDDSVNYESGPVVLLQYLGGTKGANLSGRGCEFGEPKKEDVTSFLARMEDVFPGTTAAYTGTSMMSFWAASPWHKGAYSYWGIGGYTSYAGAEGLQEGNIHFAGEHTSVEYQGYMEGAIRSGKRAAREILYDL